MCTKSNVTYKISLIRTEITGIIKIYTRNSGVMVDTVEKIHTGSGKNLSFIQIESIFLNNLNNFQNIICKTWMNINQGP